LIRLIPFLSEIAREGYDDIPALLQQYQGMDADQICDEQQRRIEELRESRMRRSQHGLSGLARGSGLPEPELAPAIDLASSSARTQQLTAKDIAGASPPAPAVEHGIMGWMQRRAQDKAESQNRKMEKWHEALQKKAREKQQKTKEQS
jgi:hypothetical protein